MQKHFFSFIHPVCTICLRLMLSLNNHHTYAKAVHGHIA